MSFTSTEPYCGVVEPPALEPLEPPAAAAPLACPSLSDAEDTADFAFPAFFFASSNGSEVSPSLLIVEDCPAPTTFAPLGALSVISSAGVVASAGPWSSEPPSSSPSSESSSVAGVSGT